MKFEMSPEERDVQRALGLLNDWIIVVQDLKVLKECISAIRSPHNNSMTKESPLDLEDYCIIYVVVEAISREHAHYQIRQSNIFPEKDFELIAGWQSNIAGMYFRNRIFIKGYSKVQVRVL